MPLPHFKMPLPRIPGRPQCKLCENQAYYNYYWDEIETTIFLCIDHYKQIKLNKKLKKIKK